MKTITSASGRQETVTVKRSESADAQNIVSLISPASQAIFGRVNIIHLLEKANLAVTLCNEKDDILAHACFFDHPLGDLVDPAQWEAYLHKHYSAEACLSRNTLFLHFFVAQPDFASASVKEIMRAVFNTVAELDYICLVSPHVGPIEPELDLIFKPMERLTDPGPRCLALISKRQQHCPRLQIRRARIEDFDDITQIFNEQTRFSSIKQAVLLEVVENQNEDNHAAVCEIEGDIVGFISISATVDVNALQEQFDLKEFNWLYKTQQPQAESPGADAEPDEDEEETSSEEAQSKETLPKECDVFCIKHFAMDKKYEMRSMDFIPYAFQKFPDLSSVVTVPSQSSDIHLLQHFVRVRPLGLLKHELYMFHRAGFSVEVRPAVDADRTPVSVLMKELNLNESLLRDLDHFYATRSDKDSVPLQAFVAHVGVEVVGIVIIRDEQNIEYIRAHYNIENFIYFSHYSYEEHAQMLHFVLRPSLQHSTRHLFKEVLRLARKSCLYLRVYPPNSSQRADSSIHHLDSALDCSVPVRPRRQIIYPLEKVGINTPSRRLMENQAPFALSLISRKLTFEPKVAVNASVVVVGASDTGLSFLEALCFCPHLRFYSLTLISTHGFPGDCSHEDIGFLSTSHAYCSRDYAVIPFRYYVRIMVGKVVAINRELKYVMLSDGEKVPYDHLILCTGLQYRVPCPTGVDLSQPITNSQLPPASTCHRYEGPVPSNLFTLNDLHDCMAARCWLTANFVELEENAVVYGHGVDVYTTVETLLNLGIGGSRIHLVLSPPEPGVSCFTDLLVDKAVAACLESAGVHVHVDCVLAQMNDGGAADVLTSASFTTDDEPLRLQCGVFINLSNRGVDYDIFKSINNSFLVFDARLVISSTFRTNDCDIYGAGPLTKFSLRYYSDEWSHANFNSKEVGQELAASLLPLFDPTLEHQVKMAPETDCLVPHYNQAKIQGGKLPGGFNYLHFTKPVENNPAGLPLKEQDQVIVTGDVETGNYFCLHLDANETVETLTCFTLDPIPVSNYLSLYGKHQVLLGQLLRRYQQDQVQDLYSFFKRNSCLVVFHDRFSDLEEELNQLTSTQLKVTATDGDVDVLPPAAIEDEETRRALRTSAVKYLIYNRNLLPMFACPGDQ